MTPLPDIAIPLLGLPCPGIEPDEPDAVPPECVWFDAAREAVQSMRADNVRNFD